ncbi:hypothetical protein ACFVRB_28035 [Streptomyces nojiriensis]|uniref:hypothetical protein n=1 Tax=Streptomyces nojiriensis TaxID=66374 RepID=UPI0036DCD8F9
MGNVWTRLTQEAGELGGPDALREHYRTQGHKEAVTYAALAAAATGVAYGVNRYRKYAQDKKMDRRIAESEASGAQAEVDRGHSTV